MIKVFGGLNVLSPNNVCAKKCKKCDFYSGREEIS
jgi:hypothetical protein